MRKAILGLVCLLGLPGAVVTASAQDIVKIGLLMTYTGQFTNAAVQRDDGIKSSTATRSPARRSN